MSDSVATASTADVEVLGHPRGLITLFFTEMWERLSYYGMRALLVLFMTQQIMSGGMGLTDATATAIYGIYTALVYLVAGEAKITVAGTPHELRAGDALLMPGNRPHAVSASKRFKMVLTMIRA